MEPVAEHLKWLLLYPLGAAVVIALLPRKLGRAAAWVSVAAAGLILYTATRFLLLDWAGPGQPLRHSVEWLALGELHVDIGLWVNADTAAMLMVVAFVGFWIHLFSVGYMSDDGSQKRFFAGLSFFMFSMLGIVLADNLFMMFVFWELVGFSSYMLIAHYWDKTFAAEASKKAFVVNRIGDLGFLVGIVLAFQYYGTADLSAINEMIANGSKEAKTGIGLCLICGFLGKSAQFPLQVWLTDAMAGPTPVSALIHAATMVAAGIFLLVRLIGPIDFVVHGMAAHETLTSSMLTHEVLTVILWLGAVMAFVAGLWALGQRDIKKTLAYSTLSHLGYMATAVGLGLPGLAMFHLAMHACFKATLFLCAGSVIHGCHHEQDMFKMGGLRKRMPVTFYTFVAAALSICAVYPLAGYYSKDGILAVALAKGMLGFGTGYFGVFVLIALGAFVTAVYMGRMLFVIFFGEPNSDAARHAHESPRVMTLPLVILAALSVSAGWFVVNGWPGNIVHSLTEGFHAAEHYIEQTHIHYPLLFLSEVAALAGLALAYLAYGRGASADRLQSTAPAVYGALERHGWFDDVYGWLTRRVHDNVLCNGFAIVDLLLIASALVQGVGGLARVVGMSLRGLQAGSVHSYVYWFLIGVVLLGGFAFGYF